MNKHLETILRKMCEFVGADFDSIDFESSDWYMQHQWTQEKQDEFRDWLVDYLYTNKEAREDICEYPFKKKQHLRRIANMFIFNYGWKIKEED